jgi:hypothetical protein
MKPQTNYQRQLKGSKTSLPRVQGQTQRASGKRESFDKAKSRLNGDIIDSKFGFDRYQEVMIF